MNLNDTQSCESLHVFLSFVSSCLLVAIEVGVGWIILLGLVMCIESRLSGLTTVKRNHSPVWLTVFLDELFLIMCGICHWLITLPAKCRSRVFNFTPPIFL